MDQGPPQNASADQNASVKPMAKWKQIILVIGVLGLLSTGMYLVRPPTKDCQAHTVGKESYGTTCRLRGTVGYMDARNKNANALALGNVQFDQFWLADDSGRVAVHFDPKKLKLPAEGSRISLEATVMKQEASMVRRLLATKIE